MLEQYLKESLLDDEATDENFMLDLVKTYMDEQQKSKISIDPSTGGLVYPSDRTLYLSFEKNQDIPELKFEKVERMAVDAYGKNRREVRFPDNFFPKNAKSVVIDIMSGDVVFEQSMDIGDLKIRSYDKFKVKFLKPVNIKKLDVVDRNFVSIEGPVKIDELNIDPEYIAKYYKNNSKLNVRSVNGAE